ncbi:MAG: AMP-binding protein [Steroidobacteraceae bacterium]|jgi:long-chain acyl-CoA synthetase|nr:AMP-binding protein [Steroidobacteraceae bacterium]
MDRYWLKTYPPGVPADIDPGQYSSLKQLFDESVARFADRPAYTNFGRTITFRQLDGMSRAFGAWLQKEAKLERGDRIALMMPNCLQYPIALFGALRAGLTVVNTNPLYTQRELEHQLKDSGAKAIVVFEQAASVLQECLSEVPVEHVIVTGIGDLVGFPKGPIINFVIRHVRKQVKPYVLPTAHRFVDVLEQGKWVDLEDVDLTLEDVAFLQYTGGTTGVSKGAVLTHRNMVANTLQSQAWLRQFLADDSPVTVIAALPLYHIFALTACAFLWLRQGGCNLLITNPRDMPGFVKELKSQPFHVIFGVNTLYNGLMNTPGFETIDFKSLRASIAGGMALQGAVAQRWKEKTGCILSQGWGLTETSPVATMCRSQADFNGSVGLPVPSTEISIRDDLGRELPVGEAGEICVRGPQVMRGYYNRPEETAKVMHEGGWLKTGDIGRMDADGYVYIQDRKKDMILVSGFNVYPNEVEDVIAKHPGVLEVAAVAQPDERSGEVVAVFVVRKDNTLTAEQVVDFARQDLTGYKVPKAVYFRDELPKTNVGKILRRALRDELLKQVQAA